MHQYIPAESFHQDTTPSSSFATSSDLTALMGIVGTVATQLKQSDSSNKEQIATLAARMQASNENSAKRMDTLASAVEGMGKRMDEKFATVIEAVMEDSNKKFEAAMKDSNKKFEAIGENNLVLTKAVAAHGEMLQKLKVDTENHASTIVDHTGKIQGVQAVQKQIMEEQQRMKSLIKSMLQSAD